MKSKDELQDTVSKYIKSVKQRQILKTKHKIIFCSHYYTQQS